MSAISLSLPPSFKAAIFDFDGTLALTAGLWRTVDETFLALRGIAYSPEIHNALATRGFVEGASWCIERFGLSDTVEGICAEWTEMSRALYRTEVHLRDGVEEYLNYLRGNGIPLALATVNDRRIVASIEHIDVLSLFDAVVCGREGGRSKEYPDIYYKAASELGTGPAGCIVFEDTPEAVRTAVRAGFSTCAVCATDNPTQDFETLCSEADTSIVGWEELLVW